MIDTWLAFVSGNKNNITIFLSTCSCIFVGSVLRDTITGSQVCICSALADIYKHTVACDNCTPIATHIKFSSCSTSLQINGIVSLLNLCHSDKRVMHNGYPTGILVGFTHKWKNVVEHLFIQFLESVHSGCSIKKKLAFLSYWFVRALYVK